MPFENHTTWKSSVEADLDFESGRITLRAQRGGTAVPTAGETPERLRTSGIIPKVADSFPDNTTLLCNHVECNQTAPLLIEWTADYEWSTPEPGEPIGPGGGVPQGWRVAMQSVKGQHAIDRDINGYPITTITRESPDPPLTEEISDLAYVFSTDNRPWNPTILAMYIDAVSSDVFLGHQPGSCKVDDIQADVSATDDGPRMSAQIRIVVGRPPHARNLMEFAIQDNAPQNAAPVWRPITKPIYHYTWHRRIRAEGFYLLKQPIAGAMKDATRYRALDSFSEPVVKPVLHQVGKDSDASPGNTGRGKEIKDPDDADFYAWQTKPHLPFNTLLQSI